MAGTKVGGQKAAATNLLRYGKEFYKRIGQKAVVTVIQEGLQRILNLHV